MLSKPFQCVPRNAFFQRFKINDDVGKLGHGIGSLTGFNMILQDGLWTKNVRGQDPSTPKRRIADESVDEIPPSVLVVKAPTGQSRAGKFVAS